MQDLRVVVRGGGELGSAAARLLVLAGARVTVLERAEPLAVRRRVAYAEAVRTGTVEVEGVPGRLVGTAADPVVAGAVSVLVDPDASAVAGLAPDCLVDARMRKDDPGPRPRVAFVVALGPGPVAGVHADAVVETQRGPDLGRVLWAGTAAPDSGLPAAVSGFTGQRVLRAPSAGTFEARASIGAVVSAGEVVGMVGGTPVVAEIPGLLRGLIAGGVPVEAGVKVGDIDPRGAAVPADRISDKGRTVAAGVLEAVLLARRQGRFLRP